MQTIRGRLWLVLTVGWLVAIAGVGRSTMIASARARLASAIWSLEHGRQDGGAPVERGLAVAEIPWRERARRQPLARYEQRSGPGDPDLTIEVDVGGGVKPSLPLPAAAGAAASLGVSSERLTALRKAAREAAWVSTSSEPRAGRCGAGRPSIRLTTWDRGVPRTFSYDRCERHVPAPARALETSILTILDVDSEPFEAQTQCAFSWTESEEVVLCP
jgi:hypothetical protein